MEVLANGSGIDGLVIKNLAISNAFAFGLKLGYRLRAAAASGLWVQCRARRGWLMARFTIDDVTIRGVGSVKAGSDDHALPVGVGARASRGFRVARHRGARNVAVEDVLGFQ